MSVDRDFHYALATALVPLLLLPVAWWLAIKNWAGNKRLRALVIFDTVLAVALVYAIAITPGHAVDGASLGSPRIGVLLDDAHDKIGARVASVWEGSPAEAGGLQQDDVITQVDGRVVSDWNQLTMMIAAGEDRQPRTLTVEREGQTLEVTVIPEVGLQLPSSKSSFDVTAETDDCAGGLAQQQGGLWPMTVAIFLVALLWFRAWRRAPGRSHRWIAVVVPLAAAPIVGMGAALQTCEGIGGWSVGAFLVGAVAQGMTLLIFGGVILYLLRGQLAVIVGPKLSTGRAARLAVFYIVVALARAAVLLGVLWTIFPELNTAQDQSIAVLFNVVSDNIGRLLLVGAVVVIAPIGEEIIFRGVLLPGLSQHMRPTIALVTSAAIFGLFHVPSHGIGAMIPGMLGLVFGWARLRTGGLTAPILLHAANNGFVTMMALVFA